MFRERKRMRGFSGMTKMWHRRLADQGHGLEAHATPQRGIGVSPMARARRGEASTGFLLSRASSSERLVFHGPASAQATARQAGSPCYCLQITFVIAAAANIFCALCRSQSLEAKLARRSRNDSKSLGA